MPGDFRRNLLEAIKLRGFLGLGDLGRADAGNVPEPGSGSPGPASKSHPRRPAVTGRVRALGVGRAAAISDSVDNRAVADERAECFAPGIPVRVGQPFLADIPAHGRSN